MPSAVTHSSQLAHASINLSASDYDIVSRVFGPRVGIAEDPVTGSAHCVLAPHYAERFGNELRAYQASARVMNAMNSTINDLITVVGAGL